MELSTEEALPSKLNERFQVLRELGRGGLSNVYLVNDKLTKKTCALKVLNTSKLDQANLERFRNEFQVLKDVKHPNLVEAYELIEYPDSIAYLMEAIEGQNLLELLAQRKLDHSEIDEIFCQILTALSELHNHNLAHRDIKLENVLVGKNGIVKLSDLGLMKRLAESEDPNTGILLGTSQYLPPEYVKHSVYNFKSDLYSAGLMLYECLSGKRWLDGKKGNAAITYLYEINFEFPKLAIAGLPIKYQKILTTALAVQPWKRFASAEDMKLAILSNEGSLKTKQSVKLSENITINDVNQKRKTDRFLSIKARRERIFYLIKLFLLGFSICIIFIYLNTLEPPQSAQSQDSTTSLITDSRNLAAETSNDSKKIAEEIDFQALDHALLGN